MIWTTSLSRYSLGNIMALFEKMWKEELYEESKER